MSVTIEAHVDADEFEFGRVIEAIEAARIELETIIPIGEQALPLIEIQDEDHRTVVEELREHPAVAAVAAVEEHDDRGVYAVEWHEDPDTFFKSIRDQDAQILSAVRPDGHWVFEIRFPSRELLAAFREEIDQAELGLEVVRVSRTDRSTADPEEGLSDPQREALDLAGLLLHSAKGDDRRAGRRARDLRSGGRRTASAGDDRAGERTPLSPDGSSRLQNSHPAFSAVHSGGRSLESEAPVVARLTRSVRDTRSSATRSGGRVHSDVRWLVR